MKGCVPGHTATTVRIVDARYVPRKSRFPLPLPTYFYDPETELEEESFSDEIYKPDDPSIEFPSEQKNIKKKR